MNGCINTWKYTLQYGYEIYGFRGHILMSVICRLAVSKYVQNNSVEHTTLGKNELERIFVKHIYKNSSNFADLLCQPVP